MALVLRIKFPPTYPLIYKTLRIDKNFTVAEGIDFISETLHVAAGENIGLYLPAEKQWLDKNTPLKEYPQLEEVVRLAPLSLLGSPRFPLWCVLFFPIVGSTGGAFR